MQTLAAKTLPTIPYWQGNMIAVGRSNVKGIDSTLDATYYLRFWLVSKSRPTEREGRSIGASLPPPESPVTGTSLRTYLITRLALVVPMVFILLTLVFLLMRVAPGNPIQASLGGTRPARLRARRSNTGSASTSRSITQYGEYLWDILRGDFGTTTTDNRPLSQIIEQNGAATLELTFFAMLDSDRRRRARSASSPGATETPGSTSAGGCSASSCTRRPSSSSA